MSSHHIPLDLAGDRVTSVGRRADPQSIIDELVSSLEDMVSIYWGAGDGIHPVPQCIQRANNAIARAKGAA